MARKRMSMRKLAEVLRLRQEQKLSVRQIARSCGLARSTVADYERRAEAVGLRWPLPEGMDEERLAAVLFPTRAGEDRRPPPDLVEMANGKCTRLAIGKCTRPGACYTA